MILYFNLYLFCLILLYIILIIFTILIIYYYVNNFSSKFMTKWYYFQTLNLYLKFVYSKFNQLILFPFVWTLSLKTKIYKLLE